MTKLFLGLFSGPRLRGGLGVFLLLGCVEVMAQDEYNFSWLDPDKKIYVLQNRKYLKAEHFSLSGMMGLGISNSYRNTSVADLRLGYYFTEALGIEGFWNHSFNRQNNTHKALVNASSTALPVIREVTGQWGVLGQWAPWYAKINMFNTILYFDWYFTLGFGKIVTDLDTNTRVGGTAEIKQEDFTAYYFGTGHLYHVTQSFFVRLDFLGAAYSAPLFGNTGEETWFTNYHINLGGGVRL